MTALFYHQQPSAGHQVSVRQEKSSVDAMGQATSRLARLRRWRYGASTLAVTALLSCLGLAHAAQLSLTWTDASTNEDGFKIERATGTAGAYGQLATVAANTTGYADGTVNAGTTYCYRVRAYNTVGDSAYSSPACATPASATLYPVTVGKAGTGSGTVASSPAVIDCGSTCSASVASGTSLALSATAATGSTFTGWGGACTGTGSCAVVIDAAKSLTATFALSALTTYALTVTQSGTGSATVTSAPSGITCGSTCSGAFTAGATVTLTATPATGSTFAGWTGACTGISTTCTVTMNAAQGVTATFALASYSLTTTKAGTGNGTVTSAPTGVNCGTTCTATYTYNTSVTLTATAAAGSTFTGWSGACSGTTSICAVSMTGVQSVTATFAPSTPTPATGSGPTAYTLTANTTGSGSGLIVSTPSGVYCGATCSASFASGTIVTLAAVPTVRSTFVGWSGACSGTAATCTVPMNAAQSVKAKFARPR